MDLRRLLERDGECVGSDADPHALFFQPDTEEPNRGDASQLVLIRSTVRRYCSRCPVRLECFDYGQSFRSQGLWGGVLITTRNISSVHSNWRAGVYPDPVLQEMADIRRLLDEDRETAGRDEEVAV